MRLRLYLAICSVLKDKSGDNCSISMIIHNVDVSHRAVNQQWIKRLGKL